MGQLCQTYCFACSVAIGMATFIVGLVFFISAYVSFDIADQMRDDWSNTTCKITGFTLQHVEVSHDDGYDEDTGYDGSPGSKDGASSSFHLTTTGFAARAAEGGGPGGGFRSGDAGGGGGDDHDDDVARAGVRDGGATDEQRQSPIGDTYYTDEYRAIFNVNFVVGKTNYVSKAAQVAYGNTFLDYAVAESDIADYPVSSKAPCFVPPNPPDFVDVSRWSKTMVLLDFTPEDIDALEAKFHTYRTIGIVNLAVSLPLCCFAAPTAWAIFGPTRRGRYRGF